MESLGLAGKVPSYGSLQITATACVFHRTELMRDWNHIKGTSSLAWEDATLAARDALQKVADIVAPAAPGNAVTTGT